MAAKRRRIIDWFLWEYYLCYSHVIEMLMLLIRRQCFFKFMTSHNRMLLCATFLKRKYDSTFQCVHIFTNAPGSGICLANSILIHLGLGNMADILQTMFLYTLSRIKSLHLNQISQKFVPMDPIGSDLKLCSLDGLAPYMRQAIIWKNDGPVL